MLLLALGAVAASYYPRFAGLRCFRQPLSGVLLHPLGVTVLVAVQWVALARSLSGRPADWKRRRYGRESRCRAAENGYPTQQVVKAGPN